MYVRTCKREKYIVFLNSVTLVKTIILGEKKGLEMGLLRLPSLGFCLHTCMRLCARKHARARHCQFFRQAFGEHFLHPMHCGPEGSMAQSPSSRSSQL